MGTTHMKLFPGCFAAYLIALALLFCLPVVQAADTAQWDVFETSYESEKIYPNAFSEVEVDVVFTQGDKPWKVPAFWAGDKKSTRLACPWLGHSSSCQRFLTDLVSIYLILGIPGFATAQVFGNVAFPAVSLHHDVAGIAAIRENLEERLQGKI